MTQQLNSSLLFDCFEDRDWNNVIKILTHHCHEDDNTILESSTYYSRHHQNKEELEDVFENFLFRVDENMRTGQILEETTSQIIQLFLSLLTTTSSPSLYVTTTRTGEEDSNVVDEDRSFQWYSPTRTGVDEGGVTATTPLIHNLCIESKHIALALLLRTLDPTVASSEVQRVAHINFDYEQEIIGTSGSATTSDGGMDGDRSQSVYHNLNVYHTPLQAAWAGTLLDKNRFNNLDKIRGHDDLTAVQVDLWTTTVYLLLAFDRKPISLEFATDGDWNILPVICRYGFRCYDAVMMMALRLYPDLAQQSAVVTSSQSIGGNNGDCDLDLDLSYRAWALPLHEACKYQICYRPPAGGAGAAKVDVPMLVVAVTGTETESGTEGDRYNRHHSNPHLSFHRTSGLGPVSCVHFPAIMLLKQYQAAAFMLDINGRLPLHSALMYQKSNQKMLAAIANNKNIEKDDEDEDEEGSTATEVDDFFVIYSVPLVKALVQTNPKALEHNEPSTGLCPFLLAASDDTSTLDMVFFLLCSNTSIIVSNIMLILGKRIERSSSSSSRFDDGGEKK